MAFWTLLKQAVTEVIEPNGEQEITGEVMQTVLLNMISQLGANWNFAGVAVTSTNPGTPDGNVFYLAGAPGTYANFAGAIVGKKLTILRNNGTGGAWTAIEIDVPNYSELQSTQTNSKKIAAGNNVTMFYEGGYVNTSTGITTADVADYKYVIFPVVSGQKFVIYSDVTNSRCAFMTNETTQQSRFTLVPGKNEILIPVSCTFLAITLEYTNTGVKTGDWSKVSITLETPLVVALLDGMTKTAINFSIIQPGKNLFDKNSIVPSWYINTTTGILQSDANSAVSPLIAVTPAQMYYLSGRNVNTYEVRFLDANGTPVKPVNPDTGVSLSNYSLGVQNGKVLAPAGVVYVQFTVRFSSVGTYDSIQFEIGASATTYEAYGYKVKSDALQGIPTSGQFTTVETAANRADKNASLALSNQTVSQDGLTKRLNTNENTATPGAFPTKADASSSFAITVSADTDSPVKDLVGYKRTFLANMQVGTGTSYNTWSLPLAGAARPSEMSVAFWTKKTEFQAIFVSNFQSYLGLCTFSLNPTAAFSGTPVTATGVVTSSVELSAASMEFSIIAEVGDYVRIRLKYYNLTWKGSFVGSSILYFFLFNGSSANTKPLTFLDFTAILDKQIQGSSVYPDNGTLTGTKTLKAAYDDITANSARLTSLEGIFKGVRAKKVGNFLYVASAWNSTYDLVKSIEVIRASSNTNNPVLNLVSDYLCTKNGDPAVSAVALKSAVDDVCPANLNGSYIGGNHSWGQPYNVQMTGHGKTLADVGSVYKNASDVEFVIMRIIDADNLWIVSKNQAVDGFTYTFVAPSGVLTYVSNGTNTGSITVASSATVFNAYTTVGASTTKILIDGKNEITADGTYNGTFLDIVENYDVFDLPSIIARLIANRPGGGYVSAPQFNSLSGTEKLFNHAINYRFTKNGNTVVSTTIRTYKKLKMSFHGFIQSIALTTGNIYCPKSLPISDGSTTFDFRQITNWTAAPLIPLYLSPTYWENAVSPPDRVMNMNASVNLMMGYIIDRGIEAYRKDNVYNAMFFNTSRKIYPMGVHYQTPYVMEANTFFSAIAYRSFTNPANNPAGRTNYNYVDVGTKTFVFLDYHGSLSDFIQPEPEWIGKQILVREKNAQCTLLGDVVTGAIEILSTATPTNYGYIVLEIS